jgi:cation diffusion facilitator family transporter
MKVYDTFELPPEKAELHRRAVRLEWLTIAFFIAAVTLLALVLGQSQAMKAAWIEDMLGLVPPAAFLIAARYRNRRPNARFPYGYHRSISVAFLAGSVALLGLGAYVVYDSAVRLIAQERPPIGLIELFGVQLWLGWLMIAALFSTMVPAILLGRVKQRIARELHDKVLFADAEMNRADWLTAGAAILGVLGIGAGLWWADAVAALIIGGDIVRDGIRTTRSAVGDLMDDRPSVVDGSAPSCRWRARTISWAAWRRWRRGRDRSTGGSRISSSHRSPASSRTPETAGRPALRPLLNRSTVDRCPMPGRSNRWTPRRVVPVGCGRRFPGRCGTPQRPVLACWSSPQCSIS